MPLIALILQRKFFSKFSWLFSSSFFCPANEHGTFCTNSNSTKKWIREQWIRLHKIICLQFYNFLSEKKFNLN